MKCDVPCLRGDARPTAAPPAREFSGRHHFPVQERHVPQYLDLAGFGEEAHLSCLSGDNLEKLLGKREDAISGESQNYRYDEKDANQRQNQQFSECRFPPRRHLSKPSQQEMDELGAGQKDRLEHTPASPECETDKLPYEKLAVGVNHRGQCLD